MNLTNQGILTVILLQNDLDLVYVTPYQVKGTPCIAITSNPPDDDDDQNNHLMFDTTYIRALAVIRYHTPLITESSEIIFKYVKECF